MKQRTQKQTLIMVIIGVVALIVGGIFKYKSDHMAVNYYEIQQNASSATEAAQAISESNQQEVMFNIIGMGLLGFGAALTVVSIIALVIRMVRK